ERDEPHGCYVTTHELRAPAGPDYEHLLIPLTDRRQDPSALRELLEERRRDSRRGGADQNRIVWRIFAPPECAVAEQERNVARPDLADHLARTVQERWHALDGEHLRREVREENRLVA